jgi:hypothetical protein
MAARLLVSGGTTVLELSVVREQSRRVQLREPAPERNRSRPLRVARMLAMAHEIERLIAEGAFADRADAARKLGFTRARISQLLDLTLLAPDLQERLLTMATTEGADPITEHRLRGVVAQASWREQRVAWAILADKRPMTGGATLLDTFRLARGWGSFYIFVEGSVPMAETQISAYISEATKHQVERYAKAHGVKKGYLVEQALLHHLQALRELPADIVIPPRLLVTASSFEEVARVVKAPRAPTEALRDLLAGRALEDEP